MAVSGYLELITSLLSWHLYSAIWGILVGTGIVLIPFAAMIIGNLIDVQTKSNIKGNAGVYALKKTEVDIYMALAVILIACQPLVAISTNDVVYTTYACDGVDPVRTSIEKKLGSTSTKYDRIATTTLVDGSEIRVPVWWAFTNNLFRGVTAEAITSIPCELDVAGASIATENMRILYPGLHKETLEFAQNCWVPAANKFSRESPDLSAEGSLNSSYRSPYGARYVRRDVSWPGSHIFNRLPGYYDTIKSGVPVKRISYEPSRDGARQAAAYAEGGYPTCKDWWSQLKPDLVHTLTNHASYDSSNGDDSLQDTIAQIIALHHASGAIMPGYQISDSKAYYMINGDAIQQKAVALTGQKITSDPAIDTLTARFKGDLKEAAADLGMLVNSASHYPAMLLAREAVPMVQALLMMLLVIALPFIVVFSKYSFSTIVTVTFIQFGVIFCSFLFALAYWLDNSLVTILFDEQTLMKESSAADRAKDVLNFMSATFYVAFPVLFMAIMSWAGIKVGEGMGNLMQDTIKTSNVQQAGAAGGSMAVNAATTVVTKGRGGGKKAPKT